MLRFLAIGADNSILEQCPIKERRLYTIIGSVQIAIIVLHFLSAIFFYKQVSNNVFLAIVIATMSAFIFSMIYMFLLYTISGREVFDKERKISMFFPNLIRFILVIVFAIFTSFSLLLLLNTSYLNKEVTKIQNQELVESIASIGSNNISETNFINTKIHILTENKPVFVIFFVFMILVFFLVPLIFKILTAHNQSYKYERIKHKKEKMAIKYDYQLFKDRYKKIMYDVASVKTEFPELYYDPPFNTQRITDDRKIMPSGQLSDWVKSKHKKLEGN